MAAVREKRTALYFSVLGVILSVGAVSAISARDSEGVSLRIGMTLLALGAAMWLNWQTSIAAGALVWFLPNLLRSMIENNPLFGTTMMLELPGILALAACANLARHYLYLLEEETLVLGRSMEDVATDPETGAYEASMLRAGIESEMARSRRFSREFALVLIGIDELRQRFDYRQEEVRDASYRATAQLLKNTRHHIDRLYRYGTDGYALILPESGDKDVTGMIKRLRNIARKSTPREGEPGGPMPMNFGATFYPQCATTGEDLMRRAEIALKLSEGTVNRLHIDSADAPDEPAPELLRQPEPEPAVEEAMAILPSVEELVLPAVVAVETNGASEAVEEPKKPVIPSLPSLPDLQTVARQRVAEPIAKLRAAMSAATASSAAAKSAAASAAAETKNGATKKQPAAQSKAVASSTAKKPIEAAVSASAPVAAAQPATTAEDPLNVSDLLKHLDETLSLLKDMHKDMPSTTPPPSA